MALQSFLRKVLREGSLTVRQPDGSAFTLGDGSGPPVAVAITSRRWLARLAANPALALGEAYMDGGLVIEQGDIWDFIDLIGRNAWRRPLKPARALHRLGHDRRQQANAEAREHAAVA